VLSLNISCLLLTDVATEVTATEIAYEYRADALLLHLVKAHNKPSHIPFTCLFSRKSEDARPYINPLTPNDLQRRRSVNSLKIKIPSKNMREKPTNTSIIHSVY
jgi:hypothetical protein